MDAVRLYAEVCMLSSETGNCFSSLRRWSYNHKTGQCQQFMYGGCNGNKNNFNSKAECEQFCSKAGAYEGLQNSAGFNAFEVCLQLGVGFEWYGFFFSKS